MGTQDNNLSPKVLESRPDFHFTPPQNWMNDPNGMYYLNGEYHLFYQHNPIENNWGHMSWGHAFSTDLMHWQHLPVALHEEEGIMIFSGCIVVDYNNSSGLGNTGETPVVAIYTGYRNDDGIQFQCLAFSNNNGRNWLKYKNNPVLDIDSKDFRDPKVFWYEPDTKWIMVVASPIEKKIFFYDSQNLVNWNYCSSFQINEENHVKCECPDLFSLFVDDNPDKEIWVLLFSVVSDENGFNNGCKYFLGEFDGIKFKQNKRYRTISEQMDYGSDFYAASTWSNIPVQDGRRVCIAWMNNWKYASQFPTHTWRGSFTIPRELKLKTYFDEMILYQIPIEELETLRLEEYSFENKRSDELNRILKKTMNQGVSYELILELPIKINSIIEINIICLDQILVSISYEKENNLLIVKRNKIISNEIDEIYYIPQKAKLDIFEYIKLHIFLDEQSLEVFADNGRVVITSLILPINGSHFIQLYSNSMDFVVSKLKLWRIKMSNSGF